ncbi:hypothetical protein [Paenibacillus dakarensis]|uniref:hypothetical protein n=1 Tax=Paenibacillus dakarensis TaxID=1527293 RepID=UPI0006D54EF4|nr:hypothetical protein [Paenibacillus dakarensis]
MNQNNDLAGSQPAPRTSVRQWRVGTLSMGISLLFLGISVLIAQWKGPELLESALKWWPIIFIMLGLEIVGYTLFFRKGEYVKYDVFSILIIGFLTICCLGMAALSSTGLLDLIRKETGAVYETVQLPEIDMNVPKGVTKVIVQGNDIYHVKTDSSSSSKLLVFGSLNTTESDLLKKEDYLSSLIQTRQAGNVLYINVSEPPHSRLNRGYNKLDVTVSVPSSLKVIVRDQQGNEQSRR